MNDMSSTQEAIETDVHWKNQLNDLLRAVQNDEIGSFKDVEDFVAHIAEVARREERSIAVNEGYQLAVTHVKEILALDLPDHERDDEIQQMMLRTLKPLPASNEKQHE